MTVPRKKLIEVAIPLEAINTASAREKSIRHGHPSTLHLWWARRPLAACRALLLRKIGPAHADAAKDLAYCLYDICANKRRDSDEAASYNGLIAVWPELTRQAATIHDTRGDRQVALDL